MTLVLERSALFVAFVMTWACSAALTCRRRVRRHGTNNAAVDQRLATTASACTIAISRPLPPGRVGTPVIVDADDAPRRRAAHAAALPPPRGRVDVVPFRDYPARHHRGRHHDAPTLLCARQRPAHPLSGRRRPRRHGLARPRTSRRNSCGRPGRRPIQPGDAPPRAFPAARRTIRWAPPRSTLRGGNTPSTAPTIPTRSAASSRTAASACTTRTSRPLFAGRGRHADGRRCCAAI